jgi:predicted transposase/invertase (TIGR01784 family)
MRRDSIFYKIFQQSPQLIFDLIPNPPTPTTYSFKSIEVKETSFRIDGVFVPASPDGIVYFAEVQFQRDDTLYERLHSEASIYIYRNRDSLHDWRAITIYPSRAIEQTRHQTIQEFLDSGRIIRIYLDELGPIDQLPLSLSAMVLTTLPNPDIVPRAKQLITQAQQRPEDRGIIDIITTIICYKFNTLSRTEVEKMLALELQQSRVYQDAKAEGFEEGREEGFEEGREEGRKEGIEEKARSSTWRVLNKKVPNLPANLKPRFDKLPIAQIDRLAEDLLTFNTIADVIAWLDLAQPDRPADQ